MTLPNRNPRFADLTTAQLEQLLAQSIAALHQCIRDACDILTEMKARGETHPLMRHRVLSHHEEVSAGTMAPELALIANAKPFVLHRVKNLPVPEQASLAMGQKVPMIAVDDSGNLIEARRIIMSITSADESERVIGPHGIRPLDEQRAIAIRQREALPPPLARVRADVARGDVLVDGKRATVAELTEALRDLGYVVTRARTRRAA